MAFDSRTNNCTSNYRL